MTASSSTWASAASATFRFFSSWVMLMSFTLSDAQCYSNRDESRLSKNDQGGARLRRRPGDAARSPAGAVAPPGQRRLAQARGPATGVFLQAARGLQPHGLAA